MEIVGKWLEKIGFAWIKRMVEYTCNQWQSVREIMVAETDKTPIYNEPKLSEEQMQKVLAWLNKHNPRGAKCTVCGKAEWIINPGMIELPVGGPKVPGAHWVFPCVAAVCQNCGNTLFLCAAVVGVWPDHLEKAQASETAASAQTSAGKVL